MYRVNKAISRLGICTRREADDLVKLGKVFINSQLVEDLSANVKVGDLLKVVGKTYKFYPPQTKILMFYKPKGCITSKNDPDGRKTIYDVIKSKFHKLMPIGRLDFNTEGLMLLTNDGEFKRFMELPENEFERVYCVRAFGMLNEEKLARMSQELKSGILISGINYGKVILHYTGNLLSRDGKSNHNFTIKIYEGKNREVRKIMDHFGFKVNRLARERFGAFHLNRSFSAEFTQPVEVDMPKSVKADFKKYLEQNI